MVSIRYEDLDAKADAIKALYGQDTIYLQGEAPWEIAEECEVNDTRRIGDPLRAWFIGKHPSSGINVQWWIDVYPTGISGLDADACRRAIRGLRGRALQNFRECLSKFSRKIDERGIEYRRVAERCAADAAVLCELASEDNA